MKRTRRAGALVAALLLAMAPPAAAQVSASLAAVTAAGGATTLEKKPGCWGCQQFSGALPLCEGGHVPGYWNCSVFWWDTCFLSSPGCGAGASLPVDADGATQYVSRGQVLGIDVALVADASEYRNCEGAIVARIQAPAQIAAVRHRTATLTL